MVWSYETGSLTAKAIGEPVAAGEFLGIVGSSGNSAQPHLHFECYDSNAKLIDPYAGNCNSMNGNTSWWATQPPYYDPAILKTMTHGKPGKFGCVNEEEVNEKKVFAPGDSIYFGSYFRHAQVNTTASFVVYKPDNTIWGAASETFDATYIYNFLFLHVKLPSNFAVTDFGTWRFEGTYNGITASTPFIIAQEGRLPVVIADFGLVKKNDVYELTWLTNTEINTSHFIIQRSTDGVNFKNLANVIAKGNSTIPSRYVYAEKEPPAGIIFYRLKMMDKNGDYTYSQVRSIDNTNGRIIVSLSPNPFTGSINLKTNFDRKNLTCIISNANGQLVKKFTFTSVAYGISEVKLNGVATGIYVLQLYEKDKLLTRAKLIKK